MSNKDLFKEAIADAKAVREAALANAKVALEEAVKQIRHCRLGVNITVVRPGDICTNADKTVPPSADVNVWASTLVHMLDMAHTNNLVMPDISLGPAYK